MSDEPEKSLAARAAEIVAANPSDGDRAKAEQKPRQRKLKGLGRMLNGQYRAQVGFEGTLTGIRRPMRVYLGDDPAKARKIKERLQLEWRRVQDQGLDLWPEETLARLNREGIISRREGLKTSVASDIVGELPSTDQLAPYLDPATGKPRPEYAIKVLEIILQNILVKHESQVRLKDAFTNEFMKDPMTALERANRIMGWGKGEAMNQININAAGTINPIAFDAASDRNLIDTEIDEPTDSDN